MLTLWFLLEPVRVPGLELGPGRVLVLGPGLGLELVPELGLEPVPGLALHNQLPLRLIKPLQVINS